MEYPVKIEKMSNEQHDFWVIKSSVLKGCVGQGDTLEEALTEFEENEQEWLEAFYRMSLDEEHYLYPEMYVRIAIDEVDKAIGAASPPLLLKCKKIVLREAEKSISKLVISKEWTPNRCPTCYADLGGDNNDGYYQNPHYDVCPVCRQRLTYQD